ncbi:MAG: RNA polymerase sigma factor [Chloroflexia bacterium]|nr:RNA polymerase sigma factor [Chloroflexia bacterium]
MKGQVEVAVAEAHEREWSRVVGTFVRSTRDLDLAEDAAQDAFVSAIDAWARDGIPASPVAWLITAARRKAIDRQRRETNPLRKLPLLIVPGDDDVLPPDEIPDEHLRLIFTCCHPALAIKVRVALTLRLVCGLETATIARLFVVPLPTMAARITRAKKKSAISGIAYRVPEAHELPKRLPAVFSVVYLLFTAGHTAPSGDRLVQPELTRWALDLASIMAQFMPEEPEVLGLFGLLRLSDARREARVDSKGHLVLVERQDRLRWDHAAIQEGIVAVESSLVRTRGRLPGRYAPQAAIEAVHSEALGYEETDWQQLLCLYNLLREVAPSPIVEMNRAVIVSKLSGPDAGLAILDDLTDWDAGKHYYLFAAARADLLRRLGRVAEANAEYRRALALTDNGIEQGFLPERIGETDMAGA